MRMQSSSDFQALSLPKFMHKIQRQIPQPVFYSILFDALP